MAGATTRSFRYLDVDGQQVQLRVFLPAKAASPPKPAVVMVCGLLWLGTGTLGRIGLAFNDVFGRAFAAAGTPCVQIHTPSRHLAYTRIMDLAVSLLWPLGYFGILRAPLIIGDVAMLTTSVLDCTPLLLLPLASSLGAWALPLFHLLVRAVQWLRGAIPGPPPRDHQKEIAATVAWTQANKELLESSGRLVLCGYSSGGHCASLYGGSPEAPQFDAVVLISGIYGLRTHAWAGARRLLAPVFDMLFADILGLQTPEERDRNSPDVMVKRDLKGQDWYVLSAQMELMGLQPFEDILFQTKPLCDAVTAKGATVHRMTCGLNHWLLLLNFAGFVKPFCDSLPKQK